MANLNTEPDGFDMEGYVFRATCVAKEDLPCPRPLPKRGACSNLPASPLPPPTTLNTLNTTNSSPNSTEPTGSGGDVPGVRGQCVAVSRE